MEYARIHPSCVQGTSLREIQVWQKSQGCKTRRGNSPKREKEECAAMLRKKHKVSSTFLGPGKGLWDSIGTVASCSKKRESYT
ncbi:hypothetical protein Y1Q_0001203 [Alligator mississippiensis]|uniref:Uncharacterized protein n=1 Tax=Alligator mississippiensis TaxID=8496 RepID=A0A151PF47_ALLMI|nr:hypothetical protein Y1Q_0001203 [Alligator mississippiensis]